MGTLILGEGRVKGPVRVQCNHLNFFVHIAAATVEFRESAVRLLSIMSAFLNMEASFFAIFITTK